jgi:hypothetical protein
MVVVALVSACISSSPGPLLRASANPEGEGVGGCHSARPLRSRPAERENAFVFVAED